MTYDAVKDWLDQRNQHFANQKQLLGILGLVLFPFGLGAGVGLCYLGFLGAMHRSSGQWSNTKCLWLAIGMIPLLFLANWLMPRRDLMEERMEKGPPQSIVEHKIGKYQAMFAFICWILFTGPRLLNWSMASFREATRLKQQDTHSCAAVLWALVSRPTKVPLTDFPGLVEWLDVEATLPEVRTIPGVLFLHGPPQALSLTTDLRQAIRSGKPE